MLSLHRKTPIKSIFGIALMSTALGLTACSAPLDPDVKARQDIMKDYGDAAGINIPFPIRTIDLSDTSVKTVVNDLNTPDDTNKLDKTQTSDANKTAIE